MIALFLVGLLAFSPPLLAIFNANMLVFGIPLLFLYLFGVWAALIGLVALVIGRSGRESGPEAGGGEG